MRVFDFPITLRGQFSGVNVGERPYPEELAQCGIVGLARLALDIFLLILVISLIMRPLAAYQIFGEPESQASEHATKIVIRVADAATISLLPRQIQKKRNTHLMNVSGRSK